MYHSFVLLWCLVSCCGARCAPCRRSGCVAHRPLPLAQVAPPATGGAPLAPRTLTDRSSPTGIKNMGYPNGVSHILVPVAGLEPARCRHRWILSPLRLPIPSHRQVCIIPYCYISNRLYHFKWCALVVVLGYYTPLF